MTFPAGFCVDFSRCLILRGSWLMIVGDIDRNMRVIFAVLLLSVVVYGATFSSNLQKREVQRCYQTNEVYTECGPSCPQTCDSALRSSEVVYCPELCVPGCFCQEGHVRNRWGNCIPLEQCPCHGQNEEYSCGSACQVSCDTLGQNCMIFDDDKCVQLCRCIDGFARDISGMCIPVSNCSGHNK